jgi:hypothetical protein
MTRLRFTRADAEAEATRLALEFVAGLPGCGSDRCVGAFPDTSAPRSRASKHPVAWLVVFKAPQLAGVVMDGGEMFVSVNLQTNAIAIRE